MSLKYIFALTVFLSLPIAAQTTQEQPRPTAQSVRDDLNRRQQEDMARQRIAQQRQPGVSPVSGNSIHVGFKPALTAFDVRAIEVNDEDLRRFDGFLKQPKTGIVRLHDASVCVPNKNIIQADSPCPNNVTGKATAYSFRSDDYSFVAVSDIFFTKNTFLAPGRFTIGIFSRLGAKAEVEAQTVASDGVKQLVEFTAPETQEEAERLYALMKTGAVVGGSVYKSSAEFKLNETYVLRSIAYRGKTLRKDGGESKESGLGSDERADVLIVFRPVRRHDDGSVTIIWKELVRQPVPKLFLKENE